MKRDAYTIRLASIHDMALASIHIDMAEGHIIMANEYLLQ